jgi:hypothetical protein
MVPSFDSIAYNAVMCSLPRFYGNEGIQPDNAVMGKKVIVALQQTCLMDF